MLVVYRYCACWYDLDRIQGQGHGASKFQKFHFSRSISSAILAWSSKLMVDHDSSLQLIGARFSNFIFKKAIMWVQTWLNVDITRISNGHISVLLEAAVTRLGMPVVLYVLRILMWPWPDPRSRSLTFWSSENCTFLRLPPPQFCRGDHNWRVITIVWDLFYSFSEPDFWISPPVAGHVTSKFAKCWYHQNRLRFISALAEARSLLLWLQVGRNKPCMLAAMTVSPLAGLFYISYM